MICDMKHVVEFKRDMRHITCVAEFIRNITCLCVRVSMLVHVYICVKASVRACAFVSQIGSEREKETRGGGGGGGREREERERPRMSRHRPMVWEDRVVARKHACDAHINELCVLHI